MFILVIYRLVKVSSFYTYLCNFTNVISQDRFHIADNHIVYLNFLRLLAGFRFIRFSVRRGYYVKAFLIFFPMLRWKPCLKELVVNLTITF
jgi:hypothetical protein